MSNYTDREIYSLCTNYLNNLGYSTYFMSPYEVVYHTVYLYMERKEQGFEQ